jgi:molybdopterin synthase sulfur carrier subunit
MSVTVRIPTQLRSLSANAAVGQVEASTVAEGLMALEGAHPGFSERLFDETGGLRRFVNVFLADEDIRFLQGVDSTVTDGQTISIVPAVAGG